MFGKLGMWELILLLAIALVIFGPSKLPEIGKSIGKAVGEFRNHADKVTKDFEVSLEDGKKED